MSPEELNSRNAEILDTANPKVIDRIASTHRSTRERALFLLIGQLDPNSSSDLTVIQTLPIELLSRGDLLGALWYIETLGKMWNQISLEVLRQVIKSYIEERKYLIEWPQHEELEVLDATMRSLFRMLHGHPEYKSHPEIIFLEGQVHESKWDYQDAIKKYDVLIAAGNEEAFMAAAWVYELLWQNEFACTLLESAYSIYRNKNVIPDIIRIAAALWDRQKMMQWYTLLVSEDPKGVLPLILYKWTVENDEELRVLEEVVAAYITEGNFIPSESLARVTKQASLYVAEWIVKENIVIENLWKKDPKKWDEQENALFLASFYRRLKLMQFDVFTLANGRYVEYYLKDVQEFWFSKSRTQRAALGVFYGEYFSAEVEHEAKKRLTPEENKQIEALGGWKNKRNTDFENISLHVARIGELFLQPDFLDLQERYVVPMLRNAAVQQWEYDQELEDEMEASIAPLRDELHYYDSLRSSLRRNYEDLIEQIDEKYGTFYRRHMQVLAKNPKLKHEEYPKMLREYPDIALLFWVEKMLSGQFPTEKPEEAEALVQLYWLAKLWSNDALLFGSLMIDISPAYAISYLAFQPHLLNIPEGIYVITEALRLLDPKTRQITIGNLHTIAQEEYGARWFFEHISVLFTGIDKDNPTPEETEFMLLSRGHMAVLQRKWKQTSFLNFQLAGEEFSSIEWLLQAGDILEDAGDYEQALYFFEQALVQEDSIRIVTKILHCAILAGLYGKVDQYIQLALRKNYQIPNYIVAYYLWQWKTELAFLQVIAMLRNKQEIIDMPAWLYKLLMATLTQVLNQKDEEGKESEILRLKVYASFILGNISFSKIPPIPAKWVSHWNFCVEYIQLHSDQDNLAEIEKVFIPLTGEIEDGDTRKALSDRCIAYIDTYATNIVLTLEVMAKDEKDPEKQQETLSMMNDVRGQAAVLLQMFPGSEDIVQGWLNELTFMQWGKYNLPEADYKYPTYGIN